MNTHSIFPIGPEDKKNLERGEDAPIPAPNRPPNTRKNFPQMMRDDKNQPSKSVLDANATAELPEELPGTPFPFVPSTNSKPEIPITPLSKTLAEADKTKQPIPTELAAIKAFLKNEVNSGPAKGNEPVITSFLPKNKRAELPPALDTSATTHFAKTPLQSDHLLPPARMKEGVIQAPTQHTSNSLPPPQLVQTQRDLPQQMPALNTGKQRLDLQAPQTHTGKENNTFAQGEPSQNLQKQRQLLEESLRRERNTRDINASKVPNRSPEASKDASKSNVSNEKVRPDGSETNEAATESEFTGEVESIASPNSNSRAEALQKLVNQLIDKLYNLRQTTGRIDTTITLKNMALFEGATVTITEYDTSAGELNLSFENLSSDARSFLDQNASDLRQKLEENGHIVHLLRTTEESNEQITKFEEQTKQQDHQQQEQEQEQEEQQFVAEETKEDTEKES